MLQVSLGQRPPGEPDDREIRYIVNLQKSVFDDPNRSLYYVNLGLKVCPETLGALGDIGVEAEAVAVLVETLKDKDANLRCFAATALWKIKKDPAVITVLLNVAQVYYQVLRSERSARVLESSLQLQEERVRDVEAQNQVGTARPLAVTAQEGILRLRAGAVDAALRMAAEAPEGVGPSGRAQVDATEARREVDRLPVRPAAPPAVLRSEQVPEQLVKRRSQPALFVVGRQNNRQ